MQNRNVTAYPDSYGIPNMLVTNLGLAAPAHWARAWLNAGMYTSKTV